MWFLHTRNAPVNPPGTVMEWASGHFRSPNTLMPQEFLPHMPSSGKMLQMKWFRTVLGEIQGRS